MNDCSLLITVRNNRIGIEGREICVEDLAQIAGFLQVFVGIEGMKRGLDLDDVKNNMLDIHLAAMEALEGMMKDGLPEGGLDEKKGVNDEDGI